MFQLHLAQNGTLSYRHHADQKRYNIVHYKDYDAIDAISLCKLRDHLVPHLLLQDMADPASFKLLLPRLNLNDIYAIVPGSDEPWIRKVPVSLVFLPISPNTLSFHAPRKLKRWQNIFAAFMLLAYGLPEDAALYLLEVHHLTPLSNDSSKLETTYLKMIAEVDSQNPDAIFLRVFAAYLLHANNHWHSEAASNSADSLISSDLLLELSSHFFSKAHLLPTYLRHETFFYQENEFGMLRKEDLIHLFSPLQANLTVTRHKLCRSEFLVTHKDLEYEVYHENLRNEAYCHFSLKHLLLGSRLALDVDNDKWDNVILPLLIRDRQILVNHPYRESLIEWLNDMSSTKEQAFRLFMLDAMSKESRFARASLDEFANSVSVKISMDSFRKLNYLAKEPTFELYVLNCGSDDIHSPLREEKDPDVFAYMSLDSIYESLVQQVLRMLNLSLNTIGLQEASSLKLLIENKFGHVPFLAFISKLNRNAMKKMESLAFAHEERQLSHRNFSFVVFTKKQ